MGSRGRLRRADGGTARDGTDPRAGAGVLASCRTESEFEQPTVGGATLLVMVESREALQRALELRNDLMAPPGRSFCLRRFTELGKLWSSQPSVQRVTVLRALACTSYF